MPELAVTDGKPPPGDLPRGEFWATRLDDGTIRIDRADPRIVISAEVIAEAFASPAGACTELDLTGQPADMRVNWSGALLKINGTNRRVIYRIGEYLPRIRGYIGEWPD